MIFFIKIKKCKFNRRYQFVFGDRFAGTHFVPVERT